MQYMQTTGDNAPVLRLRHIRVRGTLAQGARQRGQHRTMANMYAATMSAGSLRDAGSNAAEDSWAAVCSLDVLYGGA